ncbi:hypothetical protein FACS1894158_02220 [Betaproteobacteria bacterium]|nr:hypothetical protein FACS1894158_02220 [Betaproteobacteria bacterium]
MLNFGTLQKTVGTVGTVGFTAQPCGLHRSDKLKKEVGTVGTQQSIDAARSDRSDREKSKSEHLKASNSKENPTVPTVPTKKHRDAENIVDSNDVTACRWLIHFADRDSLEVSITPAATHAEVLAQYPAAVAAEPFTPAARAPADTLSAADERSIREWLSSIGESDMSICDVVLDQSRHDVAARDYFLEAKA